MLFRSAVESDLDRILGCAVDEPVSWASPQRLHEKLAVGEYRFPHVWLAVDGDRVLARAVWWAFADADHPMTLDCLYVDESVAEPVDLAVALLDAAYARFRENGMTETPDCHLFLEPHWRDDPATVAAVDWRGRALARVGVTEQLERLRFEWTSDLGVPPASSRLTFAPEPDDEVFVDLFARVSVGSLDHATAQDVARLGVEGAARADLDLYSRMAGDRSWWRVAADPSGTPVGFALPSANSGGPVVGYLGVVPEFRGHGYAVDLLNEITRILAAGGATRIAADTDADNAPMRATFTRGGYRRFAARLVLEPPPGPRATVA